MTVPPTAPCRHAPVFLTVVGDVLGIIPGTVPQVPRAVLVGFSGRAEAYEGNRGIDLAHVSFVGSPHGHTGAAGWKQFYPWVLITFFP